MSGAILLFLFFDSSSNLPIFNILSLGLGLD
jgi:hypothetical protein